MISLYYMDFTSMDEKKLISEYSNKVDRERLTKVLRTKADKAKVRSLLAGYLLQAGVKDYLGKEDVLPFIYRYSGQGKPYLSNYPDIYFNISHSGNVVACAISDREVGMDIQIRVKGKEGIAKRFFTEEEQCYLKEARQKEEFERRFFELWSIKESYIKYTGLGMKQGLDTFRIDFENRAIKDPAGQDGGQVRAYFHQIGLTGLPEYAACICNSEKETEILVQKVKI